MNELMTVEVKTPANITAEDIKKYFCEKATDKEVFMFLQVCKMCNLNPFKREAYLVKYKDDQPAQILTGYDVYIKRAERSGKYGGMKAWTEGEVSSGNLKGCVDVYRKDWQNPLHQEADYSEYVQMKQDFQTKKYVPNKFWREKPKTMIKKVAISQAFRLAFPDEFDGMPYTKEEMNNVDQEAIEITPSKPVVSMPTSKDTAKMAIAQPELSLQSKQGIVEEPVKVELPPFRTITEKEGKALIALAIKNGYTKEDVKEFARDLGYKRISEINESDLETAVEFFKVPADQRIEEAVKNKDEVIDPKDVVWDENE